MPVTVTYEDGSTEHFTKKIGGGAQGTIYASADGRHAVKLYNGDGMISPQRRTEIIRHLIRDLNPARHNPYWEDFFTWPQKLVVRPSVGYRMRLLDKNMKTMANFVFPSAFNELDPTEQGWFYGRLAVAMKIAHAASRMSSAGIVYPDFSYGNIMMDCFSGEAVFIDCDSITVPGEIPAEILGTPIFYAPELWTQQQRIPTVTSDRHAFATVLYYFLVGYHPLVGDKVHYPNDAQRDDLATYGPQALYVENPADRSNRNSKQTIFAHHLGPEIDKLFRQAFVTGLHRPNERPQPAQWLPALTHAFDQVVTCDSPGQRCWWHSFVALPGNNFTCPCCHQRVKTRTLPFLYLLPHRQGHDPEAYDEHISPDKHHIVGWPGRSLYEWHITIGKSAWSTDSQHPVSHSPRATFIYDTNSSQWYLKNSALHHLEARRSKPSWTPVPIGSSVPLAHDLILRFGPGPTHFRARVEMHTLA